ncbi:Cas9 inhibitor AcrIIA9 family protein [Brevibacillus brevis]|uniref:Cas9 inhibitor AcrIIA9 family protein n=1 Tax=Brevibacillus brevis TaxID=1393 RepID=UPI00165D96D9|nr:Cas9 inhibitor AcrIIA9 family protein [Brevibacillus brevis]
MKADAIAKIKAEIDGNKSNPYIKVIGDFLIQHVEANPDQAEKVMAADKTIGKSLEAMKNEAKKKQQSGMAMLTDAEGFAIVLKYFGVKGAPVSAPAPVPPATKPIEQTASASDFDIKLDDFL